MYIVVTGLGAYADTYNVATITDAPEMILTGTGVNLSRQDLVSLVTANKFTTLNFNIDRYGKILQNCGSFTRFDPNGTAIVLAEYTTKIGIVKGYRLLLTTNNQIITMHKDDVIRNGEALNRPFLQNGVIRGGAVCCYPNNPFVRLELVTRKRPTEKVRVKSKPTKVEEKPKSWSGEQKAELLLCENRGINSDFIKNPNLSAEQMRVLWISKKNGALSEYFAKPEFSPQIMKFYADKLVSKKMVKECADMLNKPDLEMDKLTELFECVNRGIPYADLMDLPAKDIYLKRLERDKTFWTTEKIDFDALLEKAVYSSMRLKGLC